MSPESNSESTESNTSSSRSKLSRLVDQYSLNELGNRLEDYWLASSDNRYSLRELAEYVNHQLLRTVMHDAGMDPLDGEVENTYRLLTTGDVSTGTRTQLGGACNAKISMSTDLKPTSSRARRFTPI